MSEPNDDGPEPEYGYDLRAFLGPVQAPTIPDAETIAAAIERATGEPADVSDVRLEGSSVRFRVKVPLDAAIRGGLVLVADKDGIHKKESDR